MFYSVSSITRYLFKTLSPRSLWGLYRNTTVVVTRHQNGRERTETGREYQNLPNKKCLFSFVANHFCYRALMNVDPALHGGAFRAS